MTRILTPTLLLASLFACGADTDASVGEGAVDMMAEADLVEAEPQNTRSTTPPFEPIHADADVFFVSPKDGATVSNPVSLHFGLDGLELVKAGTVEDGTGHHHVIVDEGPVPAGEVVPSDPEHIHYGDAQTTAELQLEPGEHTLTLQLADGMHRSYGKPLAQTITVTVTR